MAKRVDEIAKERGLPAREVLDRLRAAGLNVKAATSTVDEAAALRALGNGGATAGQVESRPEAQRGAGPAPAQRGSETRDAGRGGRPGGGQRGSDSAAAARPRDQRTGPGASGPIVISVRGLRAVRAPSGPIVISVRGLRAVRVVRALSGPIVISVRGLRAVRVVRALSGPIVISVRGLRAVRAVRARQRSDRDQRPRSAGGQGGQGAQRSDRDQRPRPAGGQGGQGQGAQRSDRDQRPRASRAVRVVSGPIATSAPAAPAEREQPRAAADEPQPRPERSESGEHKRPTRDSLQGERAPGSAGGRRRVVIDSQASRRASTGGGAQQNQPPRRQRRGRRRRGVYDEEAESRPAAARAAVTEPDATQINSGSSVKDVAEYLDVPVPEIMKKLMALGEMKTLTQTLSDESIEVLASELGKSVEIVHSEDETIAEPVFDDAEDELVERPPVVTIMGHVDHGKTSLLDAIRETEVAKGEAGGITQHIGAYQVHHDDDMVTFLDTPGHEAFTAMRARGAKGADIAVIVVAADDGVKPQTQEAVDHAKQAGVPILVAVNKIDKEGSDPTRVRSEMTNLGLQPIEWGGDTEFVDVSARTKEGLENLLETIVTMAELEELRANPNAPASGTVIESKLDPGRGPVVTILIGRGTLEVGDALVAGAHWGRVRAMHDFLGNRVAQALPGEPVEVLGFDGVPEAGEHVRVVEHERRARQLAGERGTRLKAESLARRSGKKVSLEDIFKRGLQELNLAHQERCRRLAGSDRGRDREASADGGIGQCDPRRGRRGDGVRRDARIGV